MTQGRAIHLGHRSILRLGRGSKSVSGVAVAAVRPMPPAVSPARDEHIGALLAMRGDASRDMKQTIIETLEQGPMQASPNYVPIFRDITVSGLNVAKLLK